MSRATVDAGINGSVDVDRHENVSQRTCLRLCSQQQHCHSEQSNQSGNARHRVVVNALQRQLLACRSKISACESGAAAIAVIDLLMHLQNLKHSIKLSPCSHMRHIPVPALQANHESSAACSINRFVILTGELGYAYAVLAERTSCCHAPELDCRDDSVSPRAPLFTGKLLMFPLLGSLRHTWPCT
jgi:hypothetical protein